MGWLSTFLTELRRPMARRLVAIAPVSNERLERLDDEHIALEHKTQYSDGTTHIVQPH
jgi:hypothetical protein